MSDIQEKTETPTFYRIEQAKKEGFINSSRELNSFLSLISVIIISYFYQKNIISTFFKIFARYLSFDHSIIKNNCFSDNIILRFNNIFFIFFYFFCLYFFFIIVSTIILNGFVLNIRYIKFHGLNINIFRIIKNVFSLELYMNYCKNFLKILVIFFVFFLYIKYFFFNMIDLIFLPNFLYFKMSFYIFFYLIIFILISFIPIIVVDIFFNKFRYYNSLKMSLREIQEEYKDHESKTLIYQDNKSKKNNMKK